MAVINLTISSHIFIATAQVDEDLAKFITKNLQFFNPKIAELKRMGYSVWQVPKTIKCFSQLKSGYVLPTGFGPALRTYLQNRGDEIVIKDERVAKPLDKFNCEIVLKENQRDVVERALKLNRSIIEARPGFGKTMIGLYIMAARAQKTLIIVHTRALLAQWQKRIVDNFNLDKNDLGIIGEGKWQVGGKITLASYQTLLSRGTKQLKNEFGLVIVDECHHVPANTFTKVVRDFSAKYMLGLTATPFRKDKLDRLMTFYIGKILKTENNDDLELLVDEKNQHTVPTQLIVRDTDLQIADADEKEFTELGSILAADGARHDLIVADVVDAVKKNKDARLLILSERVAHAEALFALLQKALPRQKIILMTGQIDKKEREQLFEKIKTNQYKIMVATGGVVGEGFDWPALNTLFLTYPFSWRGKLIQYVGRVQRLAPGKTHATVYDYYDLNLSIFAAMFRKRLAAYRELKVNFL